MPTVRAYMNAKLANTRAVHLDEYCGVDAQTKPVFEDEQEANLPQTKIGVLDQIGNTIHTPSRFPFDGVLMIAVETKRMENCLSRRDLAQNERTAISEWQTFYFTRVGSALKSFCAHPLTTTSPIVGLRTIEQRRLVYRATINTLHWSQMTIRLTMHMRMQMTIRIAVQMLKILSQYPQWRHAVQRHPNTWAATSSSKV